MLRTLPNALDGVAGTRRDNGATAGKPLPYGTTYGGKWFHFLLDVTVQTYTAMSEMLMLRNMADARRRPARPTAAVPSRVRGLRRVAPLPA